ncbi:two-component system, OmpR family, sensor histidine kinase TctE [Loktanella fryxellensis]|uniref:histidine kinase n=1 Tax=Loktanella fryxellensis TaxID=245187 RepID=A0A1H8BUX1_9RHOB|nr:sensor histidine kinase [Loktanella fryxellensis]SEM85798.1 two-component system, OmpR family, sensor histidine kinase TctE [Loktanella fryxellensis]
MKAAPVLAPARAWSLRRRLMLRLLLATLLLGTLALADTWREARQTAQIVSDRVLVGSALAIAEGVSLDTAGGLEVDVPYAAIEMLTSTAQDNVFYRVDWGADGRFLTGYDDLPVGTVTGPGVAFADGSYRGVGIRSATLRREVATGEAAIPFTFTVTVAESTRARAALARAILIRSALRLGVLVIGVVALVWVAVTVALRPLVRLGDVIALRSPGDLRPVAAPTPQEVEPLVAAINSFMARLGSALGGLRNFTGNASHQLRTPLAVVRTQLALIDRSDSPAATARATAQAQAALERAERVLAQLLVLARVDAGTSEAALRPVDATAVAKDVTVDMVPAALAQDIDLGFEGAVGPPVRADAVLLAELLRNLIANAVSYAGRGAVVTVRVHRTADRTVVEVEDDGPGLPPARRAALAQAQRGVAGPVALLPLEEAGGMGLGLAVAVEIADLFGAALLLDAGPQDRGLIVRLTFPPDGPA